MDEETFLRRSSDQPVRVLIVEDNPGDSELVKLWLTRKSEGLYNVRINENLSDAMQTLEAHEFDAIVLDLSLPDAHELEALEVLQQDYAHTPIIIMSGLNDETLAAKAVQFGAQDYLLKDEANANKLKRAIRYAMQRKDSELRLAYLAQYDQLTQMPNRSAFFSSLRLRVEESQTQQQFGPVVLVIDLDGFKDINDKYGHAAGDELLVEVAKRLAFCVRLEDYICRLGGDEFSIILNKAGSIHDVNEVIERIFESFKESIALTGLSLSVSIAMCIGVACYPDGGTNADQLVKNADYAMYAVKKEGVNKSNIYDDNLRRQQRRKQVLKSDLQRAIKNEEFRLVYQPIVDGLTTDIKAFETLIRWDHPTLGLIQPYEFIDLLEQTDQIVQVGEWVLQKSCAQLKVWQQRFGQSLQMAINVSPRQFQDDSFASKVSDAISGANLNPEDLELEITENLLMSDKEKAVATLEQLKRMGVVISMDDFGTGYSQFLYLIDFPIDILKIDRSIISALGTTKGETVTKTLLTMAKGLNLLVVAEGIERKEQQDFLSNNQCDRLQGYLFAKPMDTSRCEEWMHTKSVSPKPHQ